MKKVECNPPNRTERTLIRLLGRLPGLLLCGYLPPGERTVEIDALVIRARGVLTIEAKYSDISGVLEPTSNGPWGIDGRTADSLGNLTVQARRQAQIVGPLMRRSVSRVGHVRPFAFVAGDVRLGRTITEMPVQPCVSDTVADQVERYTPIEDALTTDEIATLFAALEISPMLPTVKDLMQEGFAAPGSVRSRPKPRMPPVGKSGLRMFGDELVRDKAVDARLVAYIRDWSQNDKVAIVTTVAVWLWNRENPNFSSHTEEVRIFRDFVEFDLGVDDIVTIEQLANLLQFAVCDKDVAMDVNGNSWANQFIDRIWNELEPRAHGLFFAK